MTTALSGRYFQRLQLDPSRLDPSPTLSKLTAIVESHVKHIPFENLSQHGAPRAACLDVEATSRKILDANRGGFCYEVNSLLSEWLSTELGYSVRRIPAIVASPQHGYAQLAGGYIDSHLCMVVKVDGDDGDYFVDVGHGEPPLHPLKMEMDIEQETPEGMVSRFVRDGRYISLERRNEEKKRFEPSVRFQSDDAKIDVDQEELTPLWRFQSNFDLQFLDDSPFAQKAVCCRITRTHKYTLAGNQLKVTSPRFGFDSKKVVSEIQSAKEARSILEELFGMPMEETKGLSFRLSSMADATVHDQL